MKPTEEDERTNSIFSVEVVVTVVVEGFGVEKFKERYAVEGPETVRE